MSRASLACRKPSPRAPCPPSRARSRPTSASACSKAASELGFRVNLLAQSLTTKTVNLVAVVVNHIHDLSDLDLFDTLLSEVQAIGKQVILIRVGSVDKVEEFLRQGVAYHVDAALVFSDFADAATVRQMFRTDQVIMLNGRHDALSPAIMPNEAQGIFEAVADAAQHGRAHRRARHRPRHLAGRAGARGELSRGLRAPWHQP